MCGCGPARALACSLLMFLGHTERRTIPPDEGSARRRALYLTTHNRQIFIPVGNQTHSLSRRAATNPRLRPLGLAGSKLLTVTHRCILIFCAFYISHFTTNSARRSAMYKRRHVQCRLLLAQFLKILKCNIQFKSVQREPSCSTGRTDRQA
jgi:hypothetical protein